MKLFGREHSRPPRARPNARLAVVIVGGFLLLGAVLTPSAGAGRNLFVGVDDNAFLTDPASALPVAHDLGMTAVRVNVEWWPGQSEVDQTTVSQLQSLTTASPGFRVVLSTYARSPWLAPTDATDRDHYCNFVGSILKSVPAINDFVIWNEPNLSLFWEPQFNGDGSSASPAAYEALLARCYDVLHAIRPSVNVIAPATCPRGSDIAWDSSSISHSPGQFILGMGAAYRASGRQQPIFDTVGHHIYGTYSAERPWRVHSNTTAISEGDWRTLMDALSQAFGGTAQQIPGQCSAGSCVSIWYLESGFQTTVPAAKASFYTGVETSQHILPAVGGPPDPPSPADTSWAPDQATQFRDALRLAYCQPYVGALFNFLLRDEPDLARWQSGVLWADGTPKPSYPALKQSIAQVNSKQIDCGALKGDQTSAGAVVPGGRVSTTPARRPLRLVLSVQRRVLAGSVVHVWLRFNRLVSKERVKLQRLRGKRFHVLKRRTVSGFAPTLNLRPVKPGRYTIRVVYQDGALYRFTGTRTFAVVRAHAPSLVRAFFDEAVGSFSAFRPSPEGGGADR